MTGLRARLAILLTIVLAATVASTVTAGAANAYTSCSISPQAPYKHIRITGQKMIYGHGVLTCGTGVASSTTHVRLGKLISGTWYWYGAESWDTTFTNNVEDALAGEFLCSNYGFGSSGSGYYRTYAWANYTDLTGNHSTGTWVSATKYLSC